MCIFLSDFSTPTVLWGPYNKEHLPVYMFLPGWYIMLMLHNDGFKNMSKKWWPYQLKINCNIHLTSGKELLVTKGTG